jgi:hypothetical protein
MKTSEGIFASQQGGTEACAWRNYDRASNWWSRNGPAMTTGADPGTGLPSRVLRGGRSKFRCGQPVDAEMALRGHCQVIRLSVAALRDRG